MSQGDTVTLLYADLQSNDLSHYDTVTQENSDTAVFRNVSTMAGSLQRHNALWQGAIISRPVTQ